MTPREHDRLVKKILEGYVHEVELVKDAKDNLYFDRMGREIPYEEWYVLAMDSRYYLIDEYASPEQFVRLIWCGVYPHPNIKNKPTLAYQVKVAHVTEGGFENYFKDEYAARKNYEMISFFFDQKRLKEYIEKIIMSL